MRFRLKPGVSTLKDLPEEEFKRVAEKLGWSLEKIEGTEVQLYFLRKGGIGFSIEIEDGRVKGNYLLSESSRLYVNKLTGDLKELEGMPQVVKMSGHMHSVLRVGDIGVYDWAEFYEVVPFEGTIKLSARDVAFTRKFISSDCIGVGPDTISLSNWKKYTTKGQRQVSYLHKNLKFNCMSVKDPKATVCVLMQTMGEIQPTAEGFYEIVDTGEMTLLRAGDLIIYNKDILLHIDTYQLSGFELI